MNNELLSIIVWNILIFECIMIWIFGILNLIHKSSKTREEESKDKQLAEDTRARVKYE